MAVPGKAGIGAVLVCFTIFTFGSGARAHPGGLDAKGCHAGSRPYHCHRPQGGQPPSPQPPTSTPRATGGDLDCKDFGTWREAQDFYERNGPGDPHRLDADNDGIACEALR